jgi:Ca2+/Na+ antiporter
VAIAWFASTTVKAFILIAEINNVPAIIIGSVIGVIGASLPELAIGLVCLVKKEHEAVFSNLITSNIVNFNLGLGLAVLIMGGLVVDDISLYFKIPFMMFVMFVSTLFFFPRKVSRTHKQKLMKKGILDIGITRFEGIILLALFATWIITLLVLI